MEIQVEVTQTPPKILVKHNGETLEFSVSYTRKALAPGYSVFGVINDYWATLPVEDQAHIFSLYKTAYQGFDEIFSGDELHSQLSEIIEELFRVHPLDRLETWLLANPLVRIPASIEDDFVDNSDSYFTREKTYTKKSYAALITLAMFFRTLVPIWSEYISSNRKSVGTSHKEQAAFLLLNGTQILNCPAIEHLESFIRLTIEGLPNNYDRIVSGVASEDVPHLILAQVCLKRLCISDIVNPDETGNTHLVSRIYHFVAQVAKSSTNRENSITIKPIEASDGDESKPRSILECYRKLGELTIGEIEELEFAAEQVYKNVQLLAPDISLDLLEECLETSRTLMESRVGDPQIQMLAWVFKDVLIPQGLLYISKPTLVACLGGLEAVLWHRGFEYLAILATSSPIIGGDDIAVSPIDSRAQIPEAMKKEIAHHYPYQWTSIKRVSKVRDAPEATLEQHRILLAIDVIVDDLAANAWRATASREKLEKVFGEPRRRLTIIPTIKKEFAALIIDVENRRG